MRPPVSEDALAARFAERGARLREMAWTDIPRLAQLEREAFADDAWSAQSWWAELAGRPRREYVVVIGRPTPDVADTTDTLDAPDGSPDHTAEADGADATVGTDATDVAAEEILGYAGLDHAGDTADVMTIAIAPAGRRRGLGTLLLDTLVTRTRARGEHHLLLEVRADNTAALALYDRAGFTTLTTRRRYYPGDVDAHVMRLTLEGAS